MAKARTVFLDQHEMDLIHTQSIKSLQEIGIKVHSKPVLEILEKNFGPDHQNLAEALRNLAECYRKTGKDKEAEKVEERSIKIGFGS